MDVVVSNPSPDIIHIQARESFKSAFNRIPDMKFYIMTTMPIIVILSIILYHDYPYVLVILFLTSIIGNLMGIKLVINPILSDIIEIDTASGTVKHLWNNHNLGNPIVNLLLLRRTAPPTYTEEPESYPTIRFRRRLDIDVEYDDEDEDCFNVNFSTDRHNEYWIYFDFDFHGHAEEIVEKLQAEISLLNLR